MTTNNPNKFGFNIEDSASPNIINIPNQPAPSFPQENQASPQPVQSAESAERAVKIKKRLKIIKWSLLPLALMQLLFILPKAFPLLITVIFPIIGLLGVIKLSSFFLKLFGVYLFLLIICQIIVMIVMKGVAYIVIQTFFILFELLVGFYSYFVGNNISRLSDTDFYSLKN